MSSFLVNFSNFFNARKDRDAQEAARQQQAAQFFAQMAQQKELAQQAAEARRYEFDTSRQDALAERERAERANLITAQANDIVRPAAPMSDPLTGNPFSMKVVGSPEDLANPFVQTTTLPEAGSTQMAGQWVKATSPVMRAEAMLPVEEKRARLSKKIADDFQEAQLQRNLKLLEDVKAINPIFQKVPALYAQARMAVMMGKSPSEINIPEAAMASMLDGDEETTNQLVSLNNQMNAWRAMSSWQGPSGDNLLFNRKVQALHGQVIGLIPPDTAPDQASQAIIGLQVLAELEKRGGLDPSVIGAVREKLQQDRLSGAGGGGEEDMAKRLRNLTLKPLVEAMEQKQRLGQFGAPMAPTSPAAPPSSRGSDFLMGPRR